ncbi:hypothetical protein EIP86_007654 [Pleurotus ostreatoroseus]|nr:hypothetical protein EIP86_007654 [Pleurotus ostreatoroseus]
MTDRRVGRPSTVVTNSFEITRLPVKPFYHYDVVIIKKDPRGDKPCPRPRCTEIIEKLQDNYPNIFNPRASYDGFKNLFSSRKFDDGKYTVQIGARGVFEITITNVSTIQTSDLMRFTTKDGVLDPLVQQNTIPVTLLQVILSQGPHLAHNFSLHAKSFYEERRSFDLSGGLQGWRGFFQSVRPVLDKFIVTVNTTAAAFYHPGNLLENAMQVARIRDKRAFIHAANEPNSRILDQVRRFYKGVAVSVRPSGIRKKITGLVQAAGRQLFTKDGAQITVAEYWAEHHHIMLQYPDAFGVQVGYSDAIFPAEVCEIVTGQRYKKKLSPEDTATFISQTKAKPNEKLRDIMNAVNGRPLDYTRSPWMEDAGLQVSVQPIVATSRVLPAPTIKYGGDSLNVMNGAWNVKQQRLVRPAIIDRWAVVVFDNGRDIERRVGDFVQVLTGNMRRLGIEIRTTPYIQRGGPDVAASLTDAGMAAIHGAPRVTDSAGRSVMPRPSIILVILPRDALEMRKQVKQWGDVQHGIPTQCVRGGKYDKPGSPSSRDQYCNNVALKINAKIGGENNHAKPASANVELMMGQAMFVGCDVTHPAPGVTNRPSVATLVASMDPFATKYHVYVSVQMPRQEIIPDIAVLLHRALIDFKGKRGGLPKVVVLYRDGVSEGEYARVEQEEIRRLQEMLTKAFLPEIVGLVFIVVGKRHNHRFFPPDRSLADASGNILAGSVVDSDIVHSRHTDFYLCSHSGIIGTSRAAHYIVLKNTTDAKADALQELSYALCHVYAAATRAVSIPAPVYYADRVCARIADFQFRPDLYEDDATTEGSGNAPFPLEKWQQGLGLSRLTQQMYFL